MSDQSVTINGKSFKVSGDSRVEIVSIRPDEAELRIGGRVHIVPFVRQGNEISFVFDGETYVAEIEEAGTRRRARHRDQSMSAPMPGLVQRILVAKGDQVSRGAPLVILEAMKMEHQIVAPHDGTIIAVNCSEGEMVQPGTELVEMDEAKA